jgi:hypothetical protein
LKQISQDEVYMTYCKVVNCTKNQDLGYFCQEEPIQHY